MVSSNGFQQIIKDMTRVNENSSTIIDHINHTESIDEKISSLRGRRNS